MKQKILFFTKFILLFFSTLIFINFLCNITYASTPKLISTLQKAFENIKSWLITLATPAAAVAVRYRSFYKKI